MAKLKVFRTPTGFHDAYVAASSRRAALVAWGSDADLFARGVAEEVTDPALTAEPLASPGTVIRRSRGTVAEQMAALPPDPVRAEAVSQDEAAPRRRTKSAGTRSGPRPGPPAEPPPKPPRRAPRAPKPDGKALDAAEEALAEATRRHRAALAEFADREKRLARERRDLEQAQTAEALTLEQTRDAARATFDAELRRGQAWGREMHRDDNHRSLGLT